MLKQPVGQKRLTNIAIVRLRSHGKRFEIACYKNKVLNWRDGTETDLAEVIQTDTIFTNVTKGDVAKEKDLKTVFGNIGNEEICKRILKTGELQVSDMEREAHLEALFRDIVQIVVDRCVHPETGRQLTPLTVESALRTIGISVQPEQPAKKQALKAIEKLCCEMSDSFERAKMRLRFTCPPSVFETIKEEVSGASGARIETETTGEPSSLTFVCDPSCYRQLDRLATVTHAKESVSLQIIAATVHAESTELLGSKNAVISSFGNQPEIQTAKKDTPKTEPTTEPKKNGPACSTCATHFESTAEYRSHCRSDVHNLNLKRKVKGLPPVTDEEFAEISLDVREGFVGVE